MVTSSPGLTIISKITPFTSEGISIEALSDSRTRTVSSFRTFDPTETETSLTSAPSIPSPKSGNKISSITLIPKLSLDLVFLNLNYIFS